MDKYKNINTKENYDKLLKSGMFWVAYPELSGNWIEDEKLIIGLVNYSKKSKSLDYFDFKDLAKEVKECKDEQSKLEKVFEATKKGIVNFEEFDELLFYCF